jgi:hypothetical protein
MSNRERRENSSKLVEQLEGQLENLKELDTWFTGLAEEDQRNVLSLINLPIARKVVEVCPNPKWKIMIGMLLDLRDVKEKGGAAPQPAPPTPVKREKSLFD